MRPTEIVIGLNKLNEVQLPGMIWGSPGIGKSSVIHQIGREQNRKVYDIRLALLDPTDLRGIPYYNLKTNTAEWAPSSILPKELPRGASVDNVEKIDKDGNVISVVPTLKFENDDLEKPYLEIPEDIKMEIARDQNAILFLDEINAAPPVIQAASYQLVLDRRIGDYYLPKGVSIIAAGNNEGDKAVTFKMPTPLTNRFVHIDFEVNFEDWHNWAIMDTVEPDVVGFLNFKKGYLNKFDPTSKSRGFPTPRSWIFVSKMLDPNLPGPVMRALVGGAVGEGAAIEFMKFREIHLSLPDPGEVLDGKVPPIKDPSLSASYAMITSLSYELRDRFEKLGKSKEFLAMAATYFEFIHDSYKPEFCIMGVRDTLKTFKLPMVQAPNWKKFASSYTKFVMAA